MPPALNCAYDHRTMNVSGHFDQIFSRANAALDRKVAWIGAVILLATAQVFLIVTHQPWADEWQAALIAREAPDLATMFAWLRYEGHPWLWYGFLRLIGTVASPEAVLWIAALICAAVVQGTILFASPFARAERLLLGSSQYVLFEFLTISRGTSLGAALLTLAMLSWRSRWFWLVMALLPMVDFLFGVISGIFLILQWRDRNLWWPGVAAWALGSLFAAWSMLPAPDMISAFNAMIPITGEPAASQTIIGWLRKIGSLPLPFQGGIEPQWNTPVFPIESVGWIGMGVLCWLLTRGNGWHRLLIFGFFAFTFAMSLAVYPIGLRHLMLGAFLLILFVWRQRAANQPRDHLSSASFRLWLIILAICGIGSSTLSAQRGFDAAPLVIKQIEQLGLEDKNWVMLPEWRAAAIAAQSDIAFNRLGEDCQFTFARWDHAYTALESSDRLKSTLRAEIEKYGSFYLVSDMDFGGFPPDLITPIADIPAGFSGISYHLYLIGKGRGGKRIALDPCHKKSSDKR